MKFFFFFRWFLLPNLKSQKLSSAPSFGGFFHTSVKIQNRKKRGSYQWFWYDPCCPKCKLPGVTNNAGTLFFDTHILMCHYIHIGSQLFYFAMILLYLAGVSRWSSQALTFCIGNQLRFSLLLWTYLTITLTNVNYPNWIFFERATQRSRRFNHKYRRWFRVAGKEKLTLKNTTRLSEYTPHHQIVLKTMRIPTMWFIIQHPFKVNKFQVIPLPGTTVTNTYHNL